MQSQMGHRLDRIEHSDEDESDTAVLASDRGSKVKLTPPTPDGSPPATPDALPYRAQPYDDKDSGAVV